MEKDDIIDFFGSILPPEVTHAILSYLSPLDVVSASQVSQTFAGLLDSRGIWKRIVEEQFGPLDEQIFKGNIINWKRMYSRCCAVEKFKQHLLVPGRLRSLSYVTSFIDYDYKHKKITKKERVKTASVDKSVEISFFKDKSQKKLLARIHYIPSGSTYGTRVIGYSPKYALLLNRTAQLWDLTADCKHINEHKWKSAANKEEICKKNCGLIRESYLLEESELYWFAETKTVVYTTSAGIRCIDLNSGEESSCAVPMLEKASTPTENDEMNLFGANIDFFGSILPPEVTHTILSYLSPLDVVSASQVSQTFAGLLDSRGIWKRVVEQQFGPLDEQIFKGNIINWRKTYSRCSELSKWKKYFLLAEACKLRLPPHGEYPRSKYSTDDNALIVYQDKHKKKPCARLNIFTTSATRYSTKLLGFTGKRALIGTWTKYFLWDLTVDCKHTDEHKWKSAPNKEEICKKKCSFVREFEIASVASNYFWSDELKSIFCFTNEGIHSINLNTEEASFCAVKFLKYQEKMVLLGSWMDYRSTTKLILDFCNGLLFVNVTTQVVHLALNINCRICWLPNSLKVAVINATGNQMSVVNIAEEQPKILAKYNLNQRWDGVASSPEGHVLFIWRWTTQKKDEDAKLLTRAYLWEIGYTIGEVADVAVKAENNLVLERGKERWLELTSYTAIYFNHVMRF